MSDEQPVPPEPAVDRDDVQIQLEVATPGAGSPGPQSARRPYAEAHVLAGFMSDADVDLHLPDFAALPTWAATTVRERFGAAFRSQREPVRPTFTPITEPDVLPLVHQAARAIRADYQNLTGFEWVDIDTLVAGRLVTGPEPRYTSSFDLSRLTVAAFCLHSASPPVEMSVKMQTANNEAVLVTQCQLSVQLSPPTLQDQHVVLQYSLSPVLSPIRTLMIRGRLVALTGLEKLIALKRWGVQQALAVVYYGYGTDVLGVLPTLSEEILVGERPPLVVDFFDPEIATTIPVRIPVTIIRFRSEILSLQGS